MELNLMYNASFRSGGLSLTIHYATKMQDAKNAEESAEEEKGEAQDVVDGLGAGNILLHPSTFVVSEN
jgi:hypothetical protein